VKKRRYLTVNSSFSIKKTLGLSLKVKITSINKKVLIAAIQISMFCSSSLYLSFNSSVNSNYPRTYYGLTKNFGNANPTKIPKVMELAPVLVAAERSLSGNQFSVTLITALYRKG
jgi:hypothetical protein